MKRYIGERFGKLVLQEHQKNNKWLVKCDCGTEKLINNINNLVSGHTNSCGCLRDNLKRLDLSNKLFGSLKGLEFSHVKNGVAYWRFLCLNCNNEFVCQGRAVTRQSKPLTQCRSCSYINRDSGFNGVGRLGGSYLSILKNNAQKRDMEFNVTTEYLWDLFIKQKQQCALSGLPITLDKNYRKKIGQTASVDRIDSSNAYVEGNVQWVHKDINRIKIDFSISEFKKICFDITHWDKNYTGEIKLIPHGPRYQGVGNLSKSYWYKIKFGAESRNLEFSTSIEYAWDLFIKQCGLCSVSGQKIILDPKNKLSTASLNRINSKYGYVDSNIEWVNKRINCMMWDYDQNYFKELCKHVSEFSK